MKALLQDVSANLAGRVRTVISHCFSKRCNFGNGSFVLCTTVLLNWKKAMRNNETHWSNGKYWSMRLCPNDCGENATCTRFGPASWVSWGSLRNIDDSWTHASRKTKFQHFQTVQRYHHFLSSSKGKTSPKRSRAVLMKSIQNKWLCCCKKTYFIVAW